VPEAKVGFYGHVRQYHNLKAEIDQAILDVLESGSYVLGPQLAKFEEELADAMNVQETVGVNSGTDALLLVFLALGLGPGDEVITTSNTFFATAEAIWLAGATAVFVDSDPKTRNIDVSKIEEAITSKTRAIVPVHLYGLPANMPEIARIAKAHNLFVVEDCAQAIGARGDQFAIGELSDAVCLSFIIQKNLGCFGDGGAVATNNKGLAGAIRKLRNHGSLKRSHHSLGYNSRLDDIHAAVLRVKLQHVDEWSERRRQIARLYDQGLAEAPMTLPLRRRATSLFTIFTSLKVTIGTDCRAIWIRRVSRLLPTIRSQSISRTEFPGDTPRAFLRCLRQKNLRPACYRFPCFRNSPTKKSSA